MHARTAWAIALLLAPTGLAAAGGLATVAAPAGHAAYVEIEVGSSSPSPDLVAVEALVECTRSDPVDQALAWLGASECSAPPGSAIYVTRADSPDPADASALSPTDVIYRYEDADGVWTVREYTYGAVDDRETYHAYVMAPDAVDRVDEEGSAEAVRGLVNLSAMGVDPGERVDLSVTLGPGPQLDPVDPSVIDVRAEDVAGARAGGLTG